MAKKMLFAKHIVILIDVYGRTFFHTIKINEFLL